MRKDKWVGVDLFCGAGGMSLGFEQAGCDVVAAVDIDPIHAATHADNFASCRTICADITSVSGAELCALAGVEPRQVDVVFGGPPCQGFSMIGRRDTDDPRNRMIREFSRIVGEIRPRFFVMENVEGILMGEARATLDQFIRDAAYMGYSVVQPVRVLDASDFGVPQRRRRVFVIGHAVGEPTPDYPDCVLHQAGEQRANSATVWDAIGDLPDVDEVDDLLHSDVYLGPLGVPSSYAEMLRRDRPAQPGKSAVMASRERSLSGCARIIHSPEVRARFAATKPGSCEPVSRFFRLEKQGLAPTLRAGTDRLRGSYTAPRPIHPVRPRCITVREAARLHSLPDWFNLHHTKWHGFRQVGNSVPPFLARVVANAVVDALKASR